MLWNADYSQLELRIFASLTGCRWMVETFLEGGDIHAATAQRVLHVAVKDQTPVIRVRAKALNFGMAYGAQGDTIQEQIIKTSLQNPQLNIPVPTLAECQEMVKAYWREAPEAFQWVSFIHEDTRDKGYQETLYGRRRYFPWANSGNSQLRARVDRQSVNHIIQGTAGDLIKMAALMLWRDAPLFKADLRVQVHDELMGLVGGSQTNKQAWLEKVEEYMLLDQPLMPVPLKVVPKLVKDWKEAK